MKYLILSISLLSALSIHAQEPLSLSDAIQIGLERNYGIRIEHRNVQVAENNNTWGEAGRLPTVNLTLQSQNSVRNQQSDNLFFGGQLFPGFELNNQQTYGMTPGVTVTWNIFQGNRAIISKRRLDQLHAESEQNAEVVVANTIQSIILGYYLAVLEQQRLSEFKKQLSLSGDKFEYIQTKYDLGGAVTSDKLLEENNYLTDSASVLNQQLALNNAFRNLNLLLAKDDINTKYLLTDSLAIEDITYAYDDLVDAAFNQNVDLKKIYISQAILGANTALQESSRYPTVSLNGGYNWNRNVSNLTDARYSGPNPDYQNPPEPLVSKTGTYFANFTVSFTLFDGNRINRAIKNAMVQEDIGNIRIDQLKKNVERDLATAYDQYLVRKQLLAINERRREAAEINLQNSEEKFRNGSINSFDYRDVQNNYLSAAILELQATYNLIDSKVSLMRLTGGLVRAYNP
ncbi:Outer membrane protein TolC [Ekhidna lutea]|uniref:Outer membrane protein TolC n=1 Tax=Ekhidna lutea TaxID=447679 RepID=A0A239LMV1_EKHLU|nr:TolC family protein [Ekhidna lutea]SNT30924.1 Outer membrane protein TolC [Ekhidna lutea]